MHKNHSPLLAALSSSVFLSLSASLVLLSARFREGGTRGQPLSCQREALGRMARVKLEEGAQFAVLFGLLPSCREDLKVARSPRMDRQTLLKREWLPAWLRDYLAQRVLPSTAARRWATLPPPCHSLFPRAALVCWRFGAILRSSMVIHCSVQVFVKMLRPSHCHAM